MSKRIHRVRKRRRKDDRIDFAEAYWKDLRKLRQEHQYDEIIQWSRRVRKTTYWREWLAQLTPEERIEVKAAQKEVDQEVANDYITCILESMISRQNESYANERKVNR